MSAERRRVVITGASRGLGAELAKAFAARGFEVALVARDADAIKSLAESLGGRAYPADLCQPEQLVGLFDRIEEDGTVDVLVNNAGIDSSGRFMDLSAQNLAATYGLNVEAAAELSRQALVRMVPRGSGHLVMISSIAGILAPIGLVAYASTKAALNQLAAGIRNEYRRDGIRTTLAELGPIKTDMLDAIYRHEPTRVGYQRSYRFGFFSEMDPAKTARDIVRAVERGKRHIRRPRRTAIFAMIAAAPRRAAEIFTWGVDRD